MKKRKRKKTVYEKVTNQSSSLTHFRVTSHLSRMLPKMINDRGGQIAVRGAICAPLCFSIQSIILGKSKSKSKKTNTVGLQGHIFSCNFTFVNF